MARGYPDFFGMPIFPSYGPAQLEDSGALVLAHGDTTDLVNIIGKGKTYGGELWFDGGGTIFVNTEIIVTIDGIVSSQESPEWHFENGLDLDPNRIDRLVRLGYNTAGNKYCTYDFGKDYTFGQSLIVQLHNLSGANLTAQCWFRWARVI